LTIAVDAGLSAYDASYMWLARSLNLPLATFDPRLVAAAPACGVKLLDISTL
jgi:predicted nucleic acid-binding protein